MNTDTALRNALAVLQADPRNYRNFGIWWWPVKAVLRASFGREQLAQLGDYMDEDAMARLPRLALEDMLRAAFTEYALNARYALGSREVLDPSGEPYVLEDPDAGL